MKIGINARFLIHPYTGIGQYTHNLLQALAEIDQENEYFLFTPELVNLGLPDRFQQIRVPEQKNYRSASLRKAKWEHVSVPAEMEKWNIELAHFLYPANPRRSLSIPTIVTVHDVIPWRMPAYRRRLRSRLYHWYARSALHKADHIITVSEFSKQEIINVLKVKEKNINVIYLAPPKNNKTITMPSNLSLRRKFLLYVGGYDDRKNVPMLIKAYQKYIANDYQVDLILMGAQNQGLEPLISNKHCKYIAGKYPLKQKGQVIFTPSLNHAELMCLYKQAQALVHVSKYEGFNLPLVEAMSNGLAIIAADIPVNHEVTADNALFVDPNSIEAIGQGMLKILKTNTLRRDLSRQGRKRVKDFDWKKSAQETLCVYNLFRNY